MQGSILNTKSVPSKGWKIFKQMLEDKNYISQHLKNGGTLKDLKGKFKFVTPIHINSNKR